NAVKGKHDKFFKKTIGAGRAAEGLRADWQAQFETVRRECGFEYIRFHGLLQDELGVYSEDKTGKPKYNFQYIDAVYDAILDKGMKPFVEFGFMPEKLASGTKTIFWWKGNITPPKDYEKWANLIKALVEHWTARYGEKEVATWYFEIWNEPNLDIFFSGTQAEYFKLYDVSVKAVKSVSKNYRVGGPATAGRGWITETIDFTAKNDVPIDFITTHDYGVKGIGFDGHGNQKLFLDTSSEAIIAGVREVRQKIKESAKPNLPLHYTEWSASYSSRDPVHDSYVSAAYILSKLKGAEGFADSLSYWTFTDIFEENGTVPSPFHGGFGLINFQGLKKPSFYSYKFLNQLGEEELVNQDAESWACRNQKGAQILLWNYSPPITTESNQVFYKKDLPSKAIGDVEISLANLSSGNYKLTVYSVGYRANDVYTEYLTIGSPQHLSREQVKSLAEKTNGSPTETASVKIEKNKTFTKKLKLRENDVYLLLLEKQK
ncbi:MAG TPA: hypothetical protein PKY59_22610, partial [Pyrinomonadaceae bacterium]|nr:hypothetical protein [Pyrinomonadaceae bacterium]